jgi:nucleotide-binding universal stress UspA family protein
MSYRSILSFLGPDRHCASRTDFAIQLARDLDCHLVGAAPTGLLPFSAFAGLGQGVTMADLGQQVWDAMVREARQRVETFRTACRQAGLKSFEALVDESDQAASITRLAHCSDLVLLGQADPADAAFRQGQKLVEDVVLQSARPTLILPYAGHHASVGSRVLVAWNDSREATRAVTDALPLLRCAERVEVIAWQEPKQAESPSMVDRLDALHRWLLWQGVSAEKHLESTEIGIADALLSRAADLGTDLIVMGAYGHARWNERILGGATRGLLQSMTVPVLMSH